MVRTVGAKIFWGLPNPLSGTETRGHSVRRSTALASMLKVIRSPLEEPFAPRWLDGESTSKFVLRESVGPDADRVSIISLLSLCCRARRQKTLTSMKMIRNLIDHSALRFASQHEPDYSAESFASDVCDEAAKPVHVKTESQRRQRGPTATPSSIPCLCRQE